jgi:ABC-type oligopeptide transport system substrate-binding subunit
MRRSISIGALAVLEGLRDDEAAVLVLMKLGLSCHNAFYFDAAREAYDRAFSLGRGPSQIRERASQPPSTKPLRFELPDILTLDSARAFDVTAFIILQQLLRGLVRLDLELNVQPDVAKRWEVLEGGRRYVFHLRHDVKWSDGRSVKASDFESSRKRMLNPKNQSPIARYLYDIENARAFSEGEMSDPKAVGIVVEDDHTLTVRLEEACSYFMYLLAVPNTFPLPEGYVCDNSGSWGTPGSIIGNGPYIYWKAGSLAAGSSFGATQNTMEMFWVM